MAEQVDARVSKTRSFGSVSSSLTARTTGGARPGRRPPLSEPVAGGEGWMTAYPYEPDYCGSAGVDPRRALGSAGAFPCRVRAPVRALAQADWRDRCGRGADRAGNGAPIREGARPRRPHLARDRIQLSAPRGAGSRGGGFGAEAGGRVSGVLIPRCAWGRFSAAQLRSWRAAIAKKHVTR